VLLTKKVIIFDLDGTLAESKSILDKEMAGLLCVLFEKRNVAVIGGGDYKQFKKQFLDHLRCSNVGYRNLFLMPTSGARFFKFQKNKWEKVYECNLTQKEKLKILSAFKKVFRDINYQEPVKKYGTVIEDRGSQITFSALGQKAPLIEKENWNKKNDVRKKIKSALETYVPEFEIRLGGLTSIDITKKGIDKAYGIEKLLKFFNVSIREIVYVGDALYKGGNDFAVLRTGVDSIKIFGPNETKDLVRQILLIK